MDDGDVRGFMRSFGQAVELATRELGGGEGESLADRMSAYLGQSAAQLAVVSEEIPNHRYADWDVALDHVAARDADAEVVGIAGGDYRHHLSLADMLSGQHVRVHVGQVDYVAVPVSPTEHRRALGYGLRLFRYDGEPVVVLQRRSNPQYGRDKGALEVLCADEAVRASMLEEVRRLSIELSVLRGQVVAFESSGYGPGAQGITFIERPEIAAHEVILPAGALDRVATHVGGIAEHAEVLRRHGQHLKRGLLLYGPPGTGKTHTVRHLIARNARHTVVLLSGESLAYISHAAALARALQPSVVVLEDCDLVAEDRGMGPSGRPLLFEVLDAMDGLDGDADVTFLLTTNRVESLERALVQRPGRVDLAVEVPLPDDEGRRQLLDLYRGGIAYGATTLADAAARTEGMTASFIKELMRRAVLQAAIAGEEPSDGHLSNALEGLLAAQEDLTRALLGGASTAADSGAFGDGLPGPAPFG